MGKAASAAQEKSAGGDPCCYAAALRDAGDAPGLRKSESTRLRLLAAIARRLDDGAPEAGLRIADIVADAGVAHGTFYRYFADRQAAVEILVAGFIDFLQAGLAANRSGEAGSPDRVRAATLAYVRHFRANTGLMRRLMALDGGDTPARDRFHALNRAWNRRVARAVALRRARLSGQKAAPASSFVTTAYALGGMVDEFLAQLYLRRDPALAVLARNEGAVADLLTRLWCTGAYGDL